MLFKSKILYTSNTFLTNANVTRDCVNVTACFANIRKARFHVISSRMIASHDRHCCRGKRKRQKKHPFKKHAIRINLYILTLRVGPIQKKNCISYLGYLWIAYVHTCGRESKGKRAGGCALVGATAEGDEQATREENPVT